MSALPTRAHLADRWHSARQTPWRLRCAWHTARAEYHRRRGDYWAAINRSRASEVPPPLTRDDWQQLDRLYAAAGIERGARMSPYQLAAVLRSAPVDLAARLVERWQHSADQASRCFELGHEGNLDHWRRRALEAEAALATRSR